MAKRKLGQLPKDDREPIWNKVKAYYEAGLKFDEIVDNVEHYCQVSISKGQISTKAKQDKWIKSKNEQITNDIIDFERKNEQINEQKNELTNRLAKLSDFEITTLDEIIKDKERISSLITSTASLALIRTNQMLTNNQTVEKINMGDGIQQFEPRELNATDLKNISETIDKLSITTNVNERHAKNSVEVNNANINQTIEVEIE